MSKYATLKELISTNYMSRISQALLKFVNDGSADNAVSTIAEPGLKTLAWQSFDNGILTVAVGIEAEIKDLLPNMPNNISLSVYTLKNRVHLYADRSEKAWYNYVRWRNTPLSLMKMECYTMEKEWLFNLVYELNGDVEESSIITRNHLGELNALVDEEANKRSEKLLSAKKEEYQLEVIKQINAANLAVKGAEISSSPYMSKAIVVITSAII